jgi:hypothetical protein
MKQGVLYISYDGMLEPLGQSQVLSYLKSLEHGRRIHLISFEKTIDWVDATSRELTIQQIADAGIIWHPLRYHKRPSALATAWDIFIGIVVGAWLIGRYKLSIVHARSYVPSVIALALKRLTKVKYIFDMRGFWADERVDGGIWPSNGVMYRVAKAFERQFFLSADHIVSLTHAAVREIEKFEFLRGRKLPITVIPTCADLVSFAPGQVNTKKEFTLGYVGSAGTWYLFDAVAVFFVHLLRMYPKARFLILNRGQHKLIESELDKAGIPETSYEIVSAKHSDVPIQMARMNAGIFFYRPSFSRLACAPTKLGEFLGCGIPCISNAGVGDMESILVSERVGVALTAFDNNSINIGLQSLLKIALDPTTPARCVAAAHKNFSLDEGVARYRSIYEQLG